MRLNKNIIYFFNLKKEYVFLILAIFLFQYGHVFSATADELRDQIQSITQTKQLLQQEIAGYEKQLKDIGDQTISLKNTIKSLDVTIAKNSLDIKLTQNDIDSIQLQIEQLALGINKDVKIIDLNLKTIASLLREVNMFDTTSFMNSFLTYKNLSDFWNEQQNLYLVQNQIKEKIIDTKNTKIVMENDKSDAEKKKQELINLKADLIDRKNILDITKAEKNKLLTETRNSEVTYKKMLDDKKILADAFDKELMQFESELKLSIDPNSYPSTGKGILSWPLDFVKITQTFGKTEFGKTVYANGLHNGLDFKASVGTPVKAASSGIVKGVGDTDTVCPGKSFGKWVLIEHNNGLSTVYGHLSLIKSYEGEIVTIGGVIGYSGNTGFSTGPHLHFGVYVSQGVKVMSRKSAICSGTYIMPVADLRAYLDPLQYL